MKLLLPAGQSLCRKHLDFERTLPLRSQGNQKLVGFITAIPATVRVRKQPVRMVEINFLCVHKKLRSKRLAPVLIKVRPPRPHAHTSTCLSLQLMQFA